MRQPERITIAVNLLKTGFVISLVAAIIDGIAQGDLLYPSSLIALFIYFFIYRRLIVLIDRGHNKARISSLLLYLLSFVLALVIPPDFLGIGPVSWFDVLTGSIWIVANTIALYLLFTKPGAVWFKPHPS